MIDELFIKKKNVGCKARKLPPNMKGIATLNLPSINLWFYKYLMGISFCGFLKSEVSKLL